MKLSLINSVKIRLSDRFPDAPDFFFAFGQKCNVEDDGQYGGGFADHQKFDRSAPVRISDLSRIDVFVTDRAPPEPFRAACDLHDVEVVVARKAAADVPADSSVESTFTGQRWDFRVRTTRLPEGEVERRYFVRKAR